MPSDPNSDHDDGAEVHVNTDNVETSNVSQIMHDVDPIPHSKVVGAVDEYDYDSSDEEDIRNTIGNVPLDWYNELDHLGYDVSGGKIAKPSKENEVDEFIKKIDDPNYFRTVKDRLTGENVVISDADIDLVRRLKHGHFPDPDFNPYEDFIDFFTYEKMIHPVTNRPPTKAQFIPSISEKHQISKLVAHIKRSWQKPKVEKKKDEQFRFDFDLWETEGNVNSKRLQRFIPAPRIVPPGHAESYNPPPEYLMTDEEKKKWLEQEPEERKSNFIPQAFSALRSVPMYPKFQRERFERCLDLYLCPRFKKTRSKINPEDLIPKLPKPSELQPFPCMQSLVYNGHEDVVRSISIEQKGQFFVSGSDDCTVRIWEVLTTRCLATFKFENPVKFVSWCPDESKCLIAVATGKSLVLINPGVGDKLVISNTDSLIKSSVDGVEQSNRGNSEQTVDWEFVKESTSDWETGNRIKIAHKFNISQITWHSRGDYFSSVMPDGGNKSVVIHQLSKMRSQVPFSKSHGLIQKVLFHPSRPYFFVATQRQVRIYNLVKQSLSKKLITGCKQVSSMSIHPDGDNVIIGSFDAKVAWFDLDLSTSPYKTLRYHKNGVRAVAYHKTYPLFASASDDGTVIVSHGMVYSDLTQNALIVPVKVLRGHKIVDSVGVTDCSFHPQQPWVFSSGADKTIRLFS